MTSKKVSINNQDEWKEFENQEFDLDIFNINSTKIIALTIFYMFVLAFILVIAAYQHP